MKRTIATTALLGTLLLSGLSACSQPKAEEAAQASNTSSTASHSEMAQADKTQSPERAQRREAMRKQIEAVLTPEQKQQLQAKLQQGTKMRDAMASLNLTPEQKTKIQDIMKAARARRSEQAPASTQQ